MVEAVESFTERILGKEIDLVLVLSVVELVPVVVHLWIYIYYYDL